MDLASIERALALYSDDLLVDYYDDWVLVERERCAQMRAAALWRVVGLLASDGRIHEARSATDRLIAFDDLSEGYRRLAIGLAYLSGDRAAALVEFEGYRQTLAAEIGAEPSHETAQLVAAVKQSADRRTVARLLGADLPPGTSLDGLSRRAVPGSLPVYLTSFVGRERDIQEICAHLADQRLMTLAGPAGCGKSRLAHHVAAKVWQDADPLTPQPEDAAEWPRASVPDGVWWVDLAPIDEPRLVPQEVAAGLGLAGVPGLTTMEVLEQTVGPKALLLVLDNAEHLLEACGVVAQRLLDAGPDVRILVTSRQPLGIAGEAVWPVKPLTVPAESEAASVESVMRCEATHLFVERVLLSDPSFSLTQADATHVCGICRRLEGLPLGVELAASQVRLLPVARIRDVLDALPTTSGGPPEHAHHGTLASAIEWSYDLASPPERALYRRLAVFRGVGRSKRPRRCAPATASDPSTCRYC
jgi:hypothetical protein